MEMSEATREGFDSASGKLEEAIEKHMYVPRLVECITLRSGSAVKGLYEQSLDGWF
jgi:hypothetical protein